MGEWIRFDELKPDTFPNFCERVLCTGPQGSVFLAYFTAEYDIDDYFKLRFVYDRSGYNEKTVVYWMRIPHNKLMAETTIDRRAYGNLVTLEDWNERYGSK